MVSIFTDWLISTLHNWHFLGVAALLVVISFLSLLICLRTLGRSGLYAFMVIAVIASNLQVLKAVETGFTAFPLTLGTMLFACTYLVTDILSEYFDRKYAKRAILLGFIGYFLFNLIMILTLGFKPLEVNSGLEDWQWAYDNHHHMYSLFSPAPRFFIANITSYLIGQYVNVWIFTFIRNILPNQRWLWFRNSASSFSAAFLDDIIFNVLAWRLLTDTPLDWNVIIFTYIIGCMGIRIIMSILSIPIIYIARFFLPKGRKISNLNKRLREKYLRAQRQV